MGIHYISHDLLSAQILSDEVVCSTKDGYTRMLLEAIPNPFEQVG